LGETRLAVSFHRIVMPDGTSVSLDHFRGLNQLGDAGLRDQVDRHYWSTFGGAAAVGLVGGLSQLLGNVALGSGDGDRTVVVAGGSADAASQAATQTLSQFLNRMPTITIREGHRVKVYVTRDVDLPEWTGSATSGEED
jgi:type IV secretion system protein VirB10